jgi:hypothetical protein
MRPSECKDILLSLFLAMERSMYIMNIGLSELLIIILSLVFLLAPAIIITFSAFLFLQRIRELEKRVAKLEGAKEKENSPT